jgi:hypothetical protein
MVDIRRTMLSTGFHGSVCRSRILVAGAFSCAFWLQRLRLFRWVKLTMALPHLRLRCPSMFARRDTPREATRFRRVSPLQTFADQSPVWGIGCHSYTKREELAPS